MSELKSELSGDRRAMEGRRGLLKRKMWGAGKGQKDDSFFFASRFFLSSRIRFFFPSTPGQGA